eukprot:TCALIF_02835-PB protein Name:"Protein of unknown function" AED:0.20 eAED:0.20 QI:0/0.88/0.9/0.9/0.66/0.6/10/1951/86
MDSHLIVRRCFIALAAQDDQRGFSLFELQSGITQRLCSNPLIDTSSSQIADQPTPVGTGPVAQDLDPSVLIKSPPTTDGDGHLRPV